MFMISALGLMQVIFPFLFIIFNLYPQPDPSLTPSLTLVWPQPDPSLTPAWPPVWPQSDPQSAHHPLWSWSLITWEDDERRWWQKLQFCVLTVGSLVQNDGLFMFANTFTERIEAFSDSRRAGTLTWRIKAAVYVIIFPLSRSLTRF